MVDELRRELGLELKFEINSLGDAECRPRYRQAVLEYGRAHLAELCEDCRHRLERNPLRLLDCKIDVKLAEAAPKSQDYLCDNCRAHFAIVRELLTDAGVPYVGQSAPGARAGLLHSHHLRGHLDRGRRAERGGRRAAATTGWSSRWAARRSPVPASRSASIAWRWLWMRLASIRGPTPRWSRSATPRCAAR